MRRISQFFIGLVSAVGLVLGSAPPAGAADLDEQQLATVLNAIHFFLGEDVPSYQETNMVTGEPGESGLPRLVRTSHSVLDCEPPAAYRSLRAAWWLDTISPGDDNFSNGVPLTHVWILEFEGDISNLEAGVAELGVLFFDAGAPQLDDATFPFAKTNGSTRNSAALFFGPELAEEATGVYGVVNSENQLDVYPSPFYIGVTQLKNGNTAVVIAGPFSPGFALYVSGLAEVVQSQDELRTRLVSHATEQQPSATEPLPADQTESVPAEGGVFGIAQDGGDGGDSSGDESGSPTPTDEDGSGSDGDSTGTDDAGDESAQEGDSETPQEDGDDTGSPTDSGSGDADDDSSSGGGIFGWIFGLIIALVLAIGAYLMRNTLFGRSKRPEGAPTDGTGATPPPTLPDPEPHTPTGGTPSPDDPTDEPPSDSDPPDSHGDGPVIPAENDPPVVPVDTDPPPACDWELWFMEPSGWNKLREVAPGNTPCCIYKVTLGSSRDLAPAAGMRTDLPPGRIRTATANGTGTATSQSGSVSTGSRRDDATLPQGVLAALDAAGLPDGLERVEVAGLIEHDEHTSFTVEFESDCDGVTHRYTASGKAAASVGGQHRSDNRDPDNSTVELFTSGTVRADLTGDLSEMALARHGIDPDRHRLAPAGSVGVEDSDATSADATKDDTHWDSGFSTSAVVATGQLVPEENWPTTDEVETLAEYAASHEITLSGAATKGACGADCCGGPCLCDPSFSLQVREINGTSKQELVVDGTTWKLERQDFDDDGDAGWEATARPTLI